MAKKKEAWESETWDELKSRASLEECCKALKQREVQRVAHKKHYFKRQALTALGKALESGMTRDEALEHVKKEGYVFKVA